MPSRHLSIRMDSNVLEALQKESARSRETVSETARRLIEEGLRMEKHYGVVFRDGPTGRRAGLADGPDIWEVIAWFPTWDESWDIRSSDLIGASSLSAYQIQTAQRYYADFPEEIDERIEANERAYEEGYAEWL